MEQIQEINSQIDKNQKVIKQVSMKSKVVTLDRRIEKQYQRKQDQYLDDITQ